MPKFKSVSTRKEKKNKEGEIVEGGETCFVPLDDAAMLEPICDKALAAGMIINPLTQQPYTEPEFRAYQIELKAKLKAREAEALRKRPTY